MTPGHTPAPWRYEIGTKTIRSVPANYWLASIDSWDGAVDHEANALLIAASPSLLAAAIQHLAARDALESAQVQSLTLDDPRFAAVNETLLALRAAIRTATGGT